MIRTRSVWIYLQNRKSLCECRLCTIMCTVGVIPSTSAVRRTSPARYYPSPSYVVLVGVLSSPAPPLIAWTTNVWIILSYSGATSPSACVIASSGVWASSSCSKNLIHGCQVESICWFHCSDSQGSRCHWWICQSNIHNVFLVRRIIHAASLCGRKASNSLGPLWFPCISDCIILYNNI